MIKRKTHCDACSKLKTCARIETYNIIWICKECNNNHNEIIKESKTPWEDEVEQ